MLKGLQAGMTDAGVFDLRKYQRSIAPYYQQEPASTLAEMGKAAARGMSLTSGTDAALYRGGTLPGWASGARIPPVGKTYVGKVESALGTGFATQAGAAAIRSLMGMDEEPK